MVCLQLWIFASVEPDLITSGVKRRNFRCTKNSSPVHIIILKRVFYSLDYAKDYDKQTDSVFHKDLLNPNFIAISSLKKLIFQWFFSIPNVFAFKSYKISILIIFLATTIATILLFFSCNCQNKIFSPHQRYNNQYIEIQLHSYPSKIRGTLIGYDIHLNLVVENCVMIDKNNRETPLGGNGRGSIVIRGSEIAHFEATNKRPLY